MALPPNPLQSFIWGRGGAALTPEQVARERAVAESLMAQGIDTSPVGHWTQGAARMANVLAGKLREGRASSAESAGRTAFSDRLSSILGGGALAAPELGGSPATSAAMATAPAPDYASARVAQAHNAGGATVPTGERAEYIRQGLLNRGLPGHVADAFLMNFQDESGLNPGINEAAPLIPGSRGGYGLYQLTGPRRREYEAFAAERGSPLDDIDAQLDFLMREGSGSERAAFERILAAPDTGTAASEIVNRFLRPAQAHRESRAARYSRAPNTAVGANEAMAAGSLAGVPVADTPQDILAQEAAMAAQDPMAFQQPAAPLAEPRMVNDMPVADIAQSLTGATVNPDMPNAAGPSGMGQGSPGEKRRGPDGQLYQYVETSGMAGASGGWGWIPVADDGSQGDLSGIAQALTANQVNPDLPMAGNTSGFLPVAQSLAAQPQQQGGMPNMQQLIELASDPWATDAQRGVVQALLQQQMQAADPMRQAQLEKLRLETEALRNPAAPKLINAGDGRLYDPSSGQWITAPDMGTTKPTEAEARISRLTENLMSTGDFIDPREAQNIATGIVDGRLRADRHPVTGVLQVVDMATGQTAYQSRNAAPSAAEAMTSPDVTMPAPQFGQQFPNAPGSFGVEGAAQGAINRVTDTLGIGPAYPDVAQTQADFAVLRESLLNDIASSYGRQPPSWLLKEIRGLTPEAGSVFQGAGAAQSKLNALGRHLQGELDNTNRALQRELSPTNRQEMEARQQGLIAGLERVNGALQSFGGQQEQSGTQEDGWTVLPNGVRIRELP